MADGGGEALRPEVILPPTPPGTEVVLNTRSGVGVVVVAERVGLPYRVRPLALSLTVLAGALGLLALLTWDDPGGDEPAGVGALAPDPGRAPRGQWVLHSERLPAGADPRRRLDELVEEVRSGGFDVHRRVLGIRASLR